MAVDLVAAVYSPGSSQGVNQVAKPNPDQAFPVVVAVDDDLTAGIIEASLKTAGYRVLRALNGSHALKIINKNAARVVILDLNTSRRTGLELIRLMQAHP